jgi:hypothetical protein
MSAITRCSHTFAQDGRIHVNDYTSADRFCPDGKRLVLGPGMSAYGAADSQYRIEIDTLSKITVDGTVGAGPADS